MAQEYDNKNRFVLFKNDKQGVEARPDLTGNATLEDGTEVRLSAWIRESKNGTKFYSGQIQASEKKATETVTSIDQMEDQIPF